MSDNVKQTEWGQEIIWATQEDYTGKILVFAKKGAKTSLHFHKEKDKTYFVNLGSFKLRWVDVKDGQLYEQTLEEGSTWHCPPLQPCSLEALQDQSSVSEVNNSSNEEDVYHLIPAKNIG